MTDSVSESDSGSVPELVCSSHDSSDAAVSSSSAPESSGVATTSEAATAADSALISEEELLTVMNGFKTAGNAEFKAKDYHAAVDQYTRAIDRFNEWFSNASASALAADSSSLSSSSSSMSSDNNNTSSSVKIGSETRKVIGACLNNRGMCYFRLELFRATVDDARRAIRYKFFKAYYRRGCAFAAMGKWKQAKRDFEEAKKKFPKSKEIKDKLKQATEAYTYEKFSKAIATESLKPAHETVRMEKYGEPGSDYKGPKFDNVDDIDEDWVISLANYYKEGGTLHLKYSVAIMQRALDVFRVLPNVVHFDLPSEEEVSAAAAAESSDATDAKESDESKTKKKLPTKITVCGDIHGQFFDFLNIFALNGWPSTDNPYLFNGDFVDRGSWSVEVIMCMLSWKCVLGDKFCMTRGNHEAINMNVMYGFKGEVESKMNKEIFELFTEIFNAIPLAYILGSKVFVCHGGLFQRDGVTIDHLQAIDRFCQPSEGNTNPPDKAELMSDLLWSDPQPSEGRAPSKRGGGIMFGPDVTARFLELNGLECVIRSHEVQKDGYSLQHNGRLITIFSAPNYVDSMGNKGAFITLDRTWKPSFTQFDCVEHPDVKPMIIALSMAISRLLIAGSLLVSAVIANPERLRVVGQDLSMIQLPFEELLGEMRSSEEFTMQLNEQMQQKYSLISRSYDLGSAPDITDVSQNFQGLRMLFKQRIVQNMDDGQSVSEELTLEMKTTVDGIMDGIIAVDQSIPSMSIFLNEEQSEKQLQLLKDQTIEQHSEINQKLRNAVGKFVAESLKPKSTDNYSDDNGYSMERSLSEEEKYTYKVTNDLQSALAAYIQWFASPKDFELKMQQLLQIIDEQLKVDHDHDYFAREKDGSNQAIFS